VDLNLGNLVLDSDFLILRLNYFSKLEKKRKEKKERKKERKKGRKEGRKKGNRIKFKKDKDLIRQEE